MTPYDAMGGEATLRPLIDAFVGRIRRDSMIGFHFWNVDPLVLAQREFEFTARFLGADVAYSGRGMRHAHMRHRIMGGHFDRRRQILVELMEAHDVPAEVRIAWLGHIDRLRTTITQDAPGECTPPESKGSGPLTTGQLRIIE
ncbi:MAG: hypothetical protein AAGD10_06725 [Myxococcota bacterium]